MEYHTPSGRSSLIISARHPDADYLNILLKAGVDPNFIHPDEPGMPTALFHSVITRNFDHMELLIKHGADVDFENAAGAVPLQNMPGNNWRATYILLTNGADYSKKGVRGNNFLVFALENLRYWPPDDGSMDWRARVVDFLHERGVEVDPWVPPTD